MTTTAAAATDTLPRPVAFGSGLSVKFSASLSGDPWVVLTGDERTEQLGQLVARLIIVGLCEACDSRSTFVNVDDVDSVDYYSKEFARVGRWYIDGRESAMFLRRLLVRAGGSELSK